MYKIKYTGNFKKDLKSCQKRKYNIKLLQNIIDTLRIPEPRVIKPGINPALLFIYFVLKKLYFMLTIKKSYVKF